MVLNCEEKLARLCLWRTLSIVPVTFKVLLEQFGSAKAAIVRLPARRGRTICVRSQLMQEIEALHKLGGRFLFAGTDDFPYLLSQIDDAPPLLTIIGRRDLLQRPTLATVGARNASVNGKRLTRDYAAALGWARRVIASGLTKGGERRRCASGCAEYRHHCCCRWQTGCDLPPRERGPAPSDCRAKLAGLRTASGHTHQCAPVPLAQPPDLWPEPRDAGGRGQCAVRQSHHRTADCEIKPRGLCHSWLPAGGVRRRQQPADQVGATLVTSPSNILEGLNFVMGPESKPPQCHLRAQGAIAYPPESQSGFRAH